MCVRCVIRSLNILMSNMTAMTNDNSVMIWEISNGEKVMENNLVCGHLEDKK